MLPTPSKGSRFANQSCGNSGRPDYFRGLLCNTQQVWPPGARHDSAAPQPRQKQLVAPARVGLRTLLGPPGLTRHPVSPGPRRFGGSSSQEVSPAAASPARRPRGRGTNKRAGDREGEGHPAPSAGRSGGGGGAGGGKEREPRGAKG